MLRWPSAVHRPVVPRQVSVKIKICGLTDERAVDEACTAGTDFIGFVFEPRSPRYLTPSAAAGLAARAPANVASVAVLRKVNAAVRTEIFSEFRADWLQADADSLQALTAPDPGAPAPTALPVYRDGQVVAMPCQGVILYEAAQSGAGMRADWSAAGALARRTRLMLAGGLDADNVAEAITRVRPWGVDVSSGVESAPGVKCPHKIREFIAAAREAAAKAAC